MHFPELHLGPKLFKRQSPSYEQAAHAESVQTGVALSNPQLLLSLHLTHDPLELQNLFAEV